MNKVKILQRLGLDPRFLEKNFWGIDIHDKNYLFLGKYTQLELNYLSVDKLDEIRKNHSEFKEKLNLLPKEELEFSVNNFFNRFIPSQFKRTIIPDSPKIFSFDLSPRGCFRVPSDIQNPF